MASYKVYVNYSVSQIVDVEAGSVGEAIALAVEDVEYPNASNRFEPDSDPHVVNVTDEDGDVVWNDENAGAETVTECRTVGELLAELDWLPTDAPLATLYDWQCGLQIGMTVHGMHVCDADCGYACPIAGHAVLDIDPRPESASGVSEMCEQDRPQQ